MRSEEFWYVLLRNAFIMPIRKTDLNAAIPGDATCDVRGEAPCLRLSNERKNMSDSIMALMLGVSTFLGALGLIALLWGLRSGQFEDQSKFLDGARFDGEEELKDAVMMEQKKKEALEKKKKAEAKKDYRPAD